MLNVIAFENSGLFLPVSTYFIIKTSAYFNLKFVFDKADVALLTHYCNTCSLLLYPLFPNIFFSILDFKHSLLSLCK